MSITGSRTNKVTRNTLLEKKAKHEPITMLTSYDCLMARIVDEAGIDAILVGDSLGNVILGYENTLPVTMEEMLHHCRAVKRGVTRAMLIGDMPFLSYQVSVPEAVRNAGLFLKEGGMDAVKLEGGRERLDALRAILSAGIPVMGHLGLTPQSVHQIGGFFVQGKTAEAGKHLLEDARLLQEAGCFAIVLESVPARLAEYVSKKLIIPTIGIGAGPGCDGQVLVTHDMLGLVEQIRPKFAKVYVDIKPVIKNAVQQYKDEVEQSRFPATEHTFSITDEEWRKFLDLVEE